MGNLFRNYQTISHIFELLFGQLHGKNNIFFTELKTFYQKCLLVLQYFIFTDYMSFIFNRTMASLSTIKNKLHRIKKEDTSEVTGLSIKTFNMYNIMSLEFCKQLIIVWF